MSMRNVLSLMFTRLLAMDFYGMFLLQVFANYQTTEQDGTVTAVTLSTMLLFRVLLPKPVKS